ncbi:Reticulon [Dillenia turbinata]|uniref:Reticulon-like protein n=1 Tax=Dillenia turbinata TaxID=194707 RepID=A0AAN8W768_9MAGN
MGSTDRLFNRQKTVHEILGGGLVADVILWRQKDRTMAILMVTLVAWVVFERSGYTLLSLVSNVLLLLFVILFLWSKSAAVINRPAPPLPELYLSEEMVNEASAFIRIHVNSLLSTSKDIAVGKDSGMFFKLAGSLMLISLVGGLTDFLTLGYTSLLIVLILPALYERYEDHTDHFVMIGCQKLQHLYMKFDVECISKVWSWIQGKRKLS